MTDVLIIGAGPTAISSIQALPENLSVAVATGSSSSAVEKGVHPKIRTVALSRKEQVGISREIFFYGHKSGMLADTSIAGGLANYWGQQYVRYAEGDPWPRNIFLSYSEYIQSCDEVDSLFSFSVNYAGNLDFQHEKYAVRVPRLVLGSHSNPDSGLYSMRDVFYSLVSAKGISILEKRVLGWEDLGKAVRVYFSDGTQLDTKWVILAAGPVGSLRLCMQSCNDLLSVKLSDHAPKLLYFLGTSQRFRSMGFDIRHFNSMTIEQIDSEKTKLFASFYRMSESSVGLLLASLRLPPFLLRTAPPKVVDLITPIQVWTEKTYVSYRIDRNSNKASVLTMPERHQDRVLLDFFSYLSGMGKVLHKSQTPPGFGFHYHAGMVSFDGNNYTTIASYLSERYREKIICVDASILPNIGVRPHTLTAMAAGFKIVSNAIQA